MFVSAILAVAPISAAAAAGTAIEAPMVAFVNPAALGSGGDLDLSPLGMFMAADAVVQSVILLLIAASIISWTIALAKWIEIKREWQLLRSGARKLIGAPDISSIGETGCRPISDMIVNAEDEIAASGLNVPDVSGEGVKDRVALRLDRVAAAQRRRMGRAVGILAIISSTAPFVGLFGTVWGIMNSFIGIAHSRTTNLAVVAPGIAEALLTTAVGLFAAIPAAILYNVFARGLATYGGELGDAGAAILCVAGREVDRIDARG